MINMYLLVLLWKHEFRSIQHTEYDRRNLDNYNQKKINNVMKMTGKNTVYSESSSNTMIV